VGKKKVEPSVILLSDTQ